MIRDTRPARVSSRTDENRLQKQKATNICGFDYTGNGRNQPYPYEAGRGWLEYVEPGSKTNQQPHLRNSEVPICGKERRMSGAGPLKFAPRDYLGCAIMDQPQGESPFLQSPR